MLVSKQTAAPLVATPRLALPTVATSSRECALRQRQSIKCHVSLDQQDKEMRAAEKRWEQQLQEGRVKNITCAEAAEMLQTGWTLLDVRPPNESQKVGVKGAIEIPLFVPDEAMDPSSLLKQMSAFGMGGWWLGGTHMVANTNFMREVQSQIPRDAKVIVACQKGLRSLAASEQLSRAGYGTLAWINGGFDTCEKAELETTNGKDIRYSGIGGLSEVLGWTEVQQSESRGIGDKAGTVIKVAVGLLVLDALVFGYEQIQYMLNNPGS